MQADLGSRFELLEKQFEDAIKCRIERLEKLMEPEEQEPSGGLIPINMQEAIEVLSNQPTVAQKVPQIAEAFDRLDKELCILIERAKILRAKLVPVCLPPLPLGVEKPIAIIPDPPGMRLTPMTKRLEKFIDGVKVAVKDLNYILDGLQI